jgi:hypothetical protein
MDRAQILLRLKLQKIAAGETSTGGTAAGSSSAPLGFGGVDWNALKTGIKNQVKTTMTDAGKYFTDKATDAQQAIGTMTDDVVSPNVTDLLGGYDSVYQKSPQEANNLLYTALQGYKVLKSGDAQKPFNLDAALQMVDPQLQQMAETDKNKFTDVVSTAARAFQDPSGKGVPTEQLMPLLSKYTSSWTPAEQQAQFNRFADQSNMPLEQRKAALANMAMAQSWITVKKWLQDYWPVLAAGGLGLIGIYALLTSKSRDKEEKSEQEQPFNYGRLMGKY